MKRMLQHVYVTFYGVQVWYKRFLEETELCVYILCSAGKRKSCIFTTLCFQEIYLFLLMK